ncbi:hypothetical protein NG271_212 [Saccharomyces cerevisiae synthetic construct]|uniref:Putative uncharacterized protein YDL041W n=2 Tax=Saccharomyces cerevisiae TaxID=4932 RepID=YD041_YEAST|nr:RecName: Full=Putative uncharacterized protein YDL041W [Saccharomyces cerevisiae S288C]KZV12190.1 hypothetical protein WN66_01007 [Saccharomyces cerevisiae]WNF19769.1 hypothetical protein NG271_212 [Saccharomyces cerevisiae synthetic construct]CAY78468.1 EC1118_1D0_1915p [Saccharomyces cerevisiae EC1118]CAA96448.1 unknown [Saccharomyces cerevisiae]CAA98601.1 unnamed protein product [Saccharomyces cerevisiae]
MIGPLGVSGFKTSLDIDTTEAADTAKGSMSLVGLSSIDATSPSAALVCPSGSVVLVSLKESGCATFIFLCEGSSLFIMSSGCFLIASLSCVGLTVFETLFSLVFDTAYFICGMVIQL